MEYENKDDEMNHITAALEEELFSQVIAIPLYSLTNVTAYGERITFEFDAYHYFLGWGGFKYMYFNR